MTNRARSLILLLISAAIIGLGCLNASALATHWSDWESGNPAASEASLTYLPFGLYGEVTADVLVDRLSDSGEKLAFVGTSNGLYVVSLDGTLCHFLYSPFGVRFVTLIDDVTGDGNREVVVVLNDVQVPAVRCYDGATWEKLWQFTPMVRVWDRRWVDLQLSVAGIEIRRGGEAQSVVVTAGRCAFSIDARDGTKQWEFRANRTLGKVVAVADLNGDEIDELFIGSEEGTLNLLDGRSGDLLWHTELPEYEDRNRRVVTPRVNDILVLDEEVRRVMVTSTDGFARMFDLGRRSLEWETDVFGVQDYGGCLRIALVPHASGNGSARALVVEGLDSSGYATSSRSVALLDSGGTVVWIRNLQVWGHLAPQVGSFDGKSAILESTERQIRLIDLADGESVAKIIPVNKLDNKAAIVKQLGDEQYLLLSSLGDMSMVSSSGEMQWYYPRIDHITALSADFVGDSATDTLFSCEWDSSVRTTTYGENYRKSTGLQGPGALQARSLHMMDGATRAISWSYEIPPAELIAVGGVKGIRLAPDLVGGDNVPDIIGFRGDTVLIFSGADGTLSTLPVGQTITSIDVLRNGASDWAVAVGVAEPGDTAHPREYGLVIVNSAGEKLWSTTYADWVAEYGFCHGFTVLDDLNSDNVSDLAIAYTSQILILTSIDGAAKYELSRIFPADEGWTISLLQLVPDSDGDGIQELACIQEGKWPGVPEPGQTLPPAACPSLSIWSPADGRLLLKTEIQGQVHECHLSCGDFDGDGWADSLFLVSAGGCVTSTHQSIRGFSLQVISGKDGRVLWTKPYEVFSFSWSGIGSTALPAVMVGDVDGAEDIVVVTHGGSRDYREDTLFQTRLEVYGASAAGPVSVIPASPSLRRSQWQNREFDGTMLLVDTDRDGHPEVISSVIEPLVPYRPGSANPFDYWEPYQSQILAVTDIATGRHLATFAGLAPATVSVFDTNEPHCLGLAARGCAYFMSLSTPLEIAAPEEGARTGPVVGLAWEGASEGEFVQVFVGGVRNYSGNDAGVDLQLSRGKHEIVVRSVDDYGRVSYGPSDLGSPLTIEVTPSLWKPVLLVMSLFALLAVTLLLSAPRLHRMLRARRREETLR